MINCNTYKLNYCCRFFLTWISVLYLLVGKVFATDYNTLNEHLDSEANKLLNLVDTAPIEDNFISELNLFNDKELP